MSYCLLVLITFTALPFIHLSESLNRTLLMDQYISVCGFKLCNTSSFDIKPDLNYTSNCPDCKCDKGCWNRRDCCPDIFLSLPVENKVDVNFMSIPEGSREKYVGMIDTCPEDADQKMKHACESDKTLVEKLQNVPVYAGPYEQTFRNSFCAECHGYKPIKHWFLDIKNKYFYDLNYCSTYRCIEDQLRQAKCNVSYAEDYLPDRSPSTQAVIRTCNVTGYWISYNTDIEYACGYQGMEMGHSKGKTHFDVFCYICNPSQPLESVTISTCNVTGKWDKIDRGLQSACEMYPALQSEQPYRNIFCRLCNQDNSDPYEVELTEGNIKVEFTPVQNQSKPAYAYNIEFLKPNIEQELDTLGQTSRGGNNDTDMKNVIEQILDNNGFFEIDGQEVNVTNLLFQYYLRTAYYDVCASPLLNVEYKNKSSDCSCDIHCIFSDVTHCCADVYILFRSCINEYELSLQKDDEAVDWIVINECPVNYNDRLVAGLCSGKESGSDLQNIPVQVRDGKTTFKNIFCAMCHLKNRSDSYEMFLATIKFFNLSIVCPLPIPIWNEQSLRGILNQARSEGCVIRYRPISSAFACNKRLSSVAESTCDQVNMWQPKDPDVQWACEKTDMFPQFKGYRNIFCEICNPDTEVHFYIDKCNLTGLWKTYDSGINNGCIAYPSLQIMITNFYRNSLCRLCNYPDWESEIPANNMLSTGSIKAHYTRLQGNNPESRSYRTFFTVNADQPDNSPTTEKCEVHQVYDGWKKMCRDLLCYPGKHLQNGTCIPLLRTTTNIYYSMALKISGNTQDSNVVINSFLGELSIRLTEFMASYLDVSYTNLQFTSLTAMSNVACPNKSSVVPNRTDIEILLDIRFGIINEYINRLEMEKLLFELHKTKMSIKYGGKKLFFDVYKDETADYLSVTSRKISVSENCLVKKTYESRYVPHFTYRTSHVSKLLLCRHVSVDENLFTVDSTGTTISFSGSDTVLKYPNFEFIEKGKIRICEDNIPVAIEEAEEEGIIEYALYVLTVVLVSVSIVCLVLQLVPYLRYDYLRTLPGLNNVGLTSSLLTVQVAFLIHAHISPENYAACSFFGLLLHLLWLMFFAWTSVCCIHMYRLFVSDDFYSDDKMRYVNLRKYAMFTIAFSVIIILLNVFINLGTSEGTSVGYGGPGCFITTTVSKVLSFIVPIIVLCIFNAVMFGVTFYYIRSQVQHSFHNLDRDVKKDGMHMMKLFIKLFVVTGLTWILQIIDGFFVISPFSFIVTVINGSQGVLILYLNYGNFKRKKGRRRPGSMFTRTTRSTTATTTSTSGYRRRTINVTSTENNANLCENGASLNEEMSSAMTNSAFEDSEIQCSCHNNNIPKTNDENVVQIEQKDVDSDKTNDSKYGSIDDLDDVSASTTGSTANLYDNVMSQIEEVFSPMTNSSFEASENICKYYENNITKTNYESEVQFEHIGVSPVGLSPKKDVNSNKTVDINCDSTDDLDDDSASREKVSDLARVEEDIVLQLTDDIVSYV